MRLATLRQAGGTVAVRVEDDAAVIIADVPDVGALLAHSDWRHRATAEGERVGLAGLAPKAWAPPVSRPSKIICVGLNYREHILEMGRELPSHPTLFAKYADALVGPYDDIESPAWANQAIDWEGELAVIIGATVRHASEDEVRMAIAGYTVLNDVTMRDYQYRTTQWLQGKTFEKTCPMGPVITTADEFAGGAALTTEVDGDVVQRARTDDLVFDPVHLVCYLSDITTLNPGDVIATGTPHGVGHAATPRRYLHPGSRLRTTIEGIGTLDNLVVSVG